MRPCCRAVPGSLRSVLQRVRLCADKTRTVRASPVRVHCMAPPTQLQEFQLKQTEQELFSILQEANKHASLNTTLRCAGGWVRDKLLGKDSVDIDIALDNILGTQFAEHLSAYLESQGQKAGRIAVVQANPEKSKHLETAKVKINELEVDLVNLRSETYVSDAAHRIPDMTFGTPEQDALRRDFTFNSMFYNINTGIVEDFTGKGKQDLADGIVRTPLQPQETFMDDPLRVLRAVRFAARFGFQLEENLERAAASQEVRQALMKKVSRERVGQELEGMFNGPDPVRAMTDIHRLQLFPAVFTLTPDADAKLPSSWGGPCVQLIAAAKATLTAVKYQEELSQEEVKTALLSALLLPLRAVQSKGKKGKTVPVVPLVIAESMKWPKKYASLVQDIQAQAPELLAVSQTLQGLGSDWQQVAPEELRTRLGLAVQQLKSNWRLGAIVASLIPLPSAKCLGVDSAEAGASESETHSNSSADMQASREDSRTAEAARVACCQGLESAVLAFKLDKCWKEAGFRPLLDGQQIIGATGAKGPEISKITGELVKWQLARPDATVQDAEAWLSNAMALKRGTKGLH